MGISINLISCFLVKLIYIRVNTTSNKWEVILHKCSNANPVYMFNGLCLFLGIDTHTVYYIYILLYYDICNIVCCWEYIQIFISIFISIYIILLPPPYGRTSRVWDFLLVMKSGCAGGRGFAPRPGQ